MSNKGGIRNSKIFLKNDQSIASDDKEVCELHNEYFSSIASNIGFSDDIPDDYDTGAHFTNDFSITIQMWWKFHFALIQVLIKWSLQNLAHGTTAGLSWHVPNFVAIWSTVIELELNEFSIKFELWWKNR